MATRVISINTRDIGVQGINNSISTSVEVAPIMANQSIIDVISKIPNVVLPIKLVQEPIRTDVDIGSILSKYAFDDLIVRTTPVGAPAIPGLYKRSESKVNTNSIFISEYIFTRLVHGIVSSSSTRNINTANTKNSLISLSIHNNLGIKKNVASYNSLISTINKFIHIDNIINNNAAVSIITPLFIKSNKSIFDKSDKYYYGLTKVFTSLVAPTDDALGEAVLDDDQVAWITKTLYNKVTPLSISTSVWLDTYYKDMYSSNSIVAKIMVPSTSTELLNGYDSYTPYYEKVAGSNVYTIELFDKGTSPIIYTLVTYSNTLYKHLNTSYLDSIATISISTVLRTSYSDKLSAVSANISKYLAYVKSSLNQIISTSTRSTSTSKQNMSSSSYLESKIVTVYDYFSDPTYVADIGYVGTQTII